MLHICFTIQGRYVGRKETFWGDSTHDVDHDDNRYDSHSDSLRVNLWRVVEAGGVEEV